MNDVPRQKLTEIVTHRQSVTARTGRDVMSDAKLCGALLRDLCGEHKREISALVAAVEERVPNDLQSSQANTPLDVLLARLTRRLIDDRALAEDAARWAVESWALALGILTPSDLNTYRVSQTSLPSILTPFSASLARVSVASSSAMKLTLAPGVTMDFARVPAGNFLMGNTEQQAKHNHEKPQHTVFLDDYLMGIAPVTVAQFAAFVQATQYQCQTKLDVKANANHPVIHVSWLDAVAFCKWVTQQTGQQVRLPTEAEWEKAARGVDGRTFPWGNAEPTDRLCNFNMTVKDTTVVGHYSPHGDSPYGCADMAGNVWEWCADWFDAAYYVRSPSKNPTGPASGTHRVLRGGSWYSEATYVRASYRDGNYPFSLDISGGFRCAH